MKRRTNPCLRDGIWDVRAVVPFDYDENIAAFCRELGGGGA